MFTENQLLLFTENVGLSLYTTIQSADGPPIFSEQVT